MAKSDRMWFGAVAFFGLFGAALPAVAEQEIGEPAPGYVEQVSVSTCPETELFEESDICTGEKMRWQLCERGSDAEHLESLAIYDCFLRSK